jgi:hypothetical protein
MLISRWCEPLSEVVSDISAGILAFSVFVKHPVDLHKLGVWEWNGMISLVWLPLEYTKADGTTLCNLAFH